MRKMSVPTVLLVALLALGPPPALAQDAPAAAGVPELVGEVRGLNQGLDRLATLLETVIRYQKLELTLKRIELAERRISPLTSRLRAAETSVQGHEEEIRRLQSMLDELRAGRSDAVRAGKSLDGFDNEIRQIELHLEIMEQELDEYHVRHTRLEDELAERREDIEVLDEGLATLVEEGP